MADLKETDLLVCPEQDCNGMQVVTEVYTANGSPLPVTMVRTTGLDCKHWQHCTQDGLLDYVKEKTLMTDKAPFRSRDHFLGVGSLIVLIALFVFLPWNTDPVLTSFFMVFAGIPAAGIFGGYFGKLLAYKYLDKKPL